MNLEHCLELFVGGLLNDVVPGVAGVVDEDIEAAAFAYGGVDEKLGEIRRGDVACYGEGIGTEERTSLCGRRGLEIVYDDGCPC